LNNKLVEVALRSAPVHDDVDVEGVRTVTLEPSFNVRFHETMLELPNTPIVPSVVIVPTKEPAPLKRTLTL
jgi:hypothetical protein